MTDHEDCLEIGDLEWSRDKQTLLLPVKIKEYPEDMDELLCAAKSRDVSRGGWVTCRAEGAAGSYVETLRGHGFIAYKVPLSYYIQAQGEPDPEFRLCFRRSHERTPPKFVYATRKCPAQYTTERNVAASVPEPKASFLSYALEEHHGFQHQLKWCRVVLAMGHEVKDSFKEMAGVWRKAEELGPMGYEEMLEFYERHGRNKRWTLAKKWFDENTSPFKDEELEEALDDGMDEYLNGPPIQGNYSVDKWHHFYGTDPEIVTVGKWGKYIVDPQVREPLWKLDGEGEATGEWDYVDGEWVNLCPPLEDLVPTPIQMAIQAGDWALVARLAQAEARK